MYHLSVSFPVAANHTFTVSSLPNFSQSPDTAPSRAEEAKSVIFVLDAVPGIVTSAPDDEVMSNLAVYFAAPNKESLILMGPLCSLELSKLFGA